ncbi:hypothetical protein ACFPYI_11725 [Halomarina salina]|uniref:Type IV pilin n=1 Tax=Halomarina salina TaxID=1872699 RepID=A0ABD5RNK8_9EURY|nr:hypothetical protein [Halomarina salina]
MSTETERIERVGYVLWGVVLATVVFGGLAVASGALDASSGGHASPPTTGDDDTSDGTDRAEAEAESRWGVPVEFEVDDDVPSFDFAVDLPGVDVSGENVGDPDDPQSVAVDTDAIDDGVARNADSGLCAIGLNEPNPSGVAVSVDGNGSASASIDPAPDETTDGPRERPQSVVDRCTDDE